MDGKHSSEPFPSLFTSLTPCGGCFTTALVANGKPHFLENHVARLLRDAKTLGLTPPPAELCAQALFDLGSHHFAAGQGIVRVDVQRDRDGNTRVLASQRELDSRPSRLKAVSSRVVHPGPGEFPGVKTVLREHYERAHAEFLAVGAHESLLFDAGDFLIEGTMTNLLVADAGGELFTPSLERGAVAGIARAFVLENISELKQREVTRAEIQGASELIAINAVRGASPIIAVDGLPIGPGKPGPWSLRLAQLFADRNGHE